MTKLEKVIKGLECCLDALVQSEHAIAENGVVMSSWQDRAKRIDAIREAIVFLKAQEPRVMTLSGVRNLKESTPIWLEDVDKKDVIGALFMGDYSDTKCVDFAIVRDWEFKRVVADYMVYGIRWRCWTSRPTEAERGEVKWND